MGEEKGAGRRKEEEKVGSMCSNVKGYSKGAVRVQWEYSWGTVGVQLERRRKQECGYFLGQAS